jgi:membrane-associated phospholipid phosphatase
LLLLTSALPAFCEGVALDVSADPDAGPAVERLTSAGPLGPAAKMDGAVSVAAASPALRGSREVLGVQTSGLTRFTQRFGDARVVGPALLASYVTGRITGLPGLSSASARVAGATFSAAVLCEGLNLAVGSVRSGAAPGSPFGRLDAGFPSGHTTVAFAAASAISAESPARWVPWVVYPVAAAVGLAQAHETGGGLGDVAAGAALGYWTGRKVDQIERGQIRIFDGARFLFRGSPRNFRVGFKARF